MDQQYEFNFDPFTLRFDISEAFRVFWDLYWRHLPSAGNTTAHRDRLLAFFKGRYLETISKHDVEAYRRWMKENGFADATINKGHMLLGRMISKLMEYKEAGTVHGIDFSKVPMPLRNPCTQVPKVKTIPRKTVATEDQFKRLLYYADDDMTDILRMLVYTGLRSCDLRRMTSDNVDLRRNILRGTQKKTVTTRNPSGVEYVLKISPKMSDILLPRMAKTKPGTPLFPMKNWQKRWNKLRELAGCPDLQRRDLRRTKATYLLDNNIDPRTVAESLGLTTLRMLPVYTPRTLQHQEKALEKLESAY